MKHALIFVIALALTTGLAWADEAAEAAFLEEIAPTEAVAEGGDCVLPDFSGMSEDEMRAAALAAGLEVQRVQAATCPTRFDCSSLTNCGAGPNCTVTNIGQCCTTGGGLGFCCPFGQTIRVRKCKCQCTAIPCLVSCPNNTDVKWNCQ